MKRTTTFALTFSLLFSLAVLIGCSGGGGGGAQPAPVTDGPAITQSVQRFFTAVSTGNTDEAAQYLAPHLRAQTSTNKVLSTLIVHDFGSDIKNPNDDASYTFTIYEGGIIQPSPEIAIVTAKYTGSNGLILTIVFSMLKEEGKWFIEGIKTGESSSGVYALGNYFPLQTGNSWKYTGTSGTTALPKYLVYSIDLSPTVVAGKNFYRLQFSEETIPASGTTTSIRAQTAPDADGYWSTDAGFWYYQANLNSGAPVKLFDSTTTLGALATTTVTEIRSGVSYTVAMEAQIEQDSPALPTVFSTAAYKVIVLRVTLRYSPALSNGVTAYQTRYFLADGLGPLKLEEYETDLVTPKRTGSIHQAKVGNTTKTALPPTPTPTVTATTTPTPTTTTTPTPTTTVTPTTTPTPTTTSIVVTPTSFPEAIVGTSYSAQVQASGGTPPYTWAAVQGLPSGLSFAPLTQTISGTPTGSAQTYSLTFTVLDALGQQKVHSAPLVVRAKIYAGSINFQNKILAGTPNKIEVTFYEIINGSNVVVGVNDSQALNTGNYALTEGRFSTAGAPSNVTQNPTSVVKNGSFYELTFASAITNLTNLSLTVTNVENSAGDKLITSTAIPVGETFRQKAFMAWGSFQAGFTDQPLKIRLNQNPGAVQGSLNILTPTTIASISMRENLADKTFIIDQTRQNFFGSIGATQFNDLLLTFAGTTDTLWTLYQGNFGGTPGFGIASHVMNGSLPTTMGQSGLVAKPDGNHFDIFQFPVSGPATATAFVFADGLEIRAVDGGGFPVSNTGVFSTPMTSGISAIDSFAPSAIGDPATLVLIEKTGIIWKGNYQYNGAGISLSNVANAGQSGTSGCSIIWMKNFGGADDEYLITDKVNNTVFMYKAGTNTRLWSFGLSSISGYLTSPDKPVSIALFLDPTYNAVTKPFDMFILVADQNGLSAYRKE